jgi:outer membrane protein W
MRKILFLSIALLVLSAGIAPAQIEYTSIGPVAGFGHNWVSNLFGMNRFNASPYLGVGLVYARDAHWGYGGQAEFSWEGYRVADQAGNISVATPMYLRVPLRVYYFFGDYKNAVRPKVYLGPSFGLKLSEQDAMRGGDVLASDDIGTFRTFDFGLNGGVGLNVRLNKGVWLNTDLGYYQGLTDAVKDPAGKYNTNQNLALSAGILFGIK